MRLKNEKGQAMVEFALVLPILVLILCGIIDFGWIFFNDIMVSSASREAARYSSIHVYDDGVVNDDDEDDVKDYILASTPLLSKALTVELEVKDGAVTACVTSPTAVLTGFTSTIFGGRTVDLTGTSTMRLEG